MYIFSRFYFVHSKSGEKYFLRILFNVIKGSNSCINICNVNGVIYSKYKSAYYTIGLLDDDREWSYCLKEAFDWASREQLYIFATITAHCEMAYTSSTIKEYLVIALLCQLSRNKNQLNFINTVFDNKKFKEN